MKKLKRDANGIAEKLHDLCDEMPSLVDHAEDTSTAYTVACLMRAHVWMINARRELEKVAGRDNHAAT